MPVSEFKRMESITPSGERAAVRFEQALTTAQWRMFQRAHEDD